MAKASGRGREALRSTSGWQPPIRQCSCNGLIKGTSGRQSAPDVPLRHLVHRCVDLPGARSRGEQKLAAPRAAVTLMDVWALSASRHARCPMSETSDETPITVEHV